MLYFPKSTCVFSPCIRFLGGVSEIYELSEPPKNLYNLIEKSLKKGAVVGCTIEVRSVLEMTKVCATHNKFQLLSLNQY